MNRYKITATNLHMGQGSISVTKVFKAESKERAEQLYLEKYLTLEIHAIEEIEPNNCNCEMCGAGYHKSNCLID